MMPLGVDFFRTNQWLPIQPLPRPCSKQMGNFILCFLLSPT